MQATPGWNGSSSAAESAAIAQDALRRYARLTNLVLASSSVAILGSGPVAEELTRILRRIGAHLIPVEAQVPPVVQALFIVGSDNRVPGIAPADQPLLVLAVDDDLDRDWFNALPAVPARAGIDGRRGPRELFWLESAG